MLPTIPPPIRAWFTDDELVVREHARRRRRPAMPCPAAAVGWIAVALCEVEAGARPRYQLKRACHPTLWEVLAPHLRCGAAPMITSHSLHRVLVQELTPGIVDGVAVVQRGRLIEPVAVRLDAAPGHWQLVELQYLPAGTGCPSLSDRAWASAVLPRAAHPLPLRRPKPPATTASPSGWAAPVPSAPRPASPRRPPRTPPRSMTPAGSTPPRTSRPAAVATTSA
jgi:hypothetical protein